MAQDIKMTKPEFSRRTKQFRFENDSNPGITGMVSSQEDGVTGIGCYVFANNCTATAYCLGQCVCGSTLFPAGFCAWAPGGGCSSIDSTCLYSTNCCPLQGTWQAMGMAAACAVTLWRKVAE